MRYAIISDIHANLEALDAVRKEIGELCPDRIVCLGDIVGYGANPEECVSIVINEGWPTILGNHDAAIIDPPQMEMMNTVARAALEWTAANLSDSSIKFLASLPMTMSLNSNSIAAHGLPHKPEQWLYSDDPYAVLASFRALPQKTLFMGHLHFAHSYKYAPSEEKLFLCQLPESVDLSLERNLVNVGSVGQPRDEDHRACLVIYDDAVHTAVYHRVQYDTIEAAKKIVAAGLPNILAQRLFLGR